LTPPPLLMPVTLVRAGDHPEKTAGTQQEQVTFLAAASKMPGLTGDALTAKIKDLRAASGMQTFDITGDDIGATGKLTINWRISVP